MIRLRQTKRHRIHIKSKYEKFTPRRGEGRGGDVSGEEMMWMGWDEKGDET
jgi:hypothetical protein